MLPAWISLRPPNANTTHFHTISPQLFMIHKRCIVIRVFSSRFIQLITMYITKRNSYTTLIVKIYLLAGMQNKVLAKTIQITRFFKITARLCLRRSFSSNYETVKCIYETVKCIIERAEFIPKHPHVHLFHFCCIFLAHFGRTRQNYLAYNLLIVSPQFLIKENRT